MSRKTFIFAGGGSGGHLFPALAIAEELNISDARARCLFVCSDRGIDAKILSGAGAEFVALPAQPPSVRPRAMMRFVSGWGPSVRTVRALIRQAKDDGDVVVVAMGGFVAAPAAQGARAEGVPVVLVNLDVVPGRANRWIARRAEARLSACAVAGRVDFQVVGPIVRAAARAPDGAPACRRAFGLEPNRPTLVITGGSQGAGSINALITAFVEAHPESLVRWQVIHQCGASDEQALRDLYSGLGIPAVVQPFLDRMGAAWGAASLTISRCGAGTVAEVQANAVPAVFFPYPFHRDDHQRRNAEPLEQAGGAVILTDFVDPQRNTAEHADALASLLRDREKLGKMADAIRGIGPSGGAANVAERLLSMA